jgi:hypothetical protein
MTKSPEGSWLAASLRNEVFRPGFLMPSSTCLGRGRLPATPVVDMERPVKLASSYQAAFLFLQVERNRWNESALEAAVSTVDHADIRGSAEAAVMVMIRRELPLTRLVGLGHYNDCRGFSFIVPARVLTRST